MILAPILSSYVAQVQNCAPGDTGSACLTNLPTVTANQPTLTNLLSVVFGVIGAVTVLIIIVQAIRFILSDGDSQKAAEARKGVIYAAVGLGVVVSAEIIIRFVIGRL